MSDPREVLDKAAAWPEHELDLGALRARATRRRGTRRIAASVAGVVAVVVVVAAVAVGGGWPGSQERVNVATRPDGGQPAPAPETDPETTRTSPLVADLTAVAVVPAGPRPERFVGVTTEGTVVVVDAGDGSIVRELAAAPDAGTRDEGAPPPNSVGDVALSADGGTVYFSAVGEPACGNTVYVPISGEEGPTVGVGGNYVALSPDGRHVATSGCFLGIASGPGETPVQLAESGGAPFSSRYFGALAWSADGRYLAVERYSGELPGDSTDIVIFDLLTARNTADGVVLRDPDGVGYRAPAFRRDGRLVVAQQAAKSGDATARVLDPSTGAIVSSFAYGGVVRDQSYDATHTWLLVTMADGSLRWFGGGEEGILPPGFTAADW